MRVIGGTARGKKLASFTGGTIRPTPDRVREAVFSSLFSRLGSWQGQTVLDLFAGSGAMGIEALSRGAEHATFVDQGAQSAKVIQNNLRACGFESRARLIHLDAFKALESLNKSASFDVIFLDPPYGQDLVNRILERLSALNCLSPRGIICAEAAKSDEVAENFGSLTKVQERAYGSTSIYFFSHQPE